MTTKRVNMKQLKTKTKFVKLILLSNIFNYLVILWINKIVYVFISFDIGLSASLLVVDFILLCLITANFIGSFGHLLKYMSHTQVCPLPKINEHNCSFPIIVYLEYCCKFGGNLLLGFTHGTPTLFCPKSPEFAYCFSLQVIRVQRINVFVIRTA